MKRLNINIRTEDVFHPIDKLGTFNREQLRSLYMQLNAIGMRASSCANACPSIPKHLAKLGLEDLVVSPVHLETYYNRVVSLCSEMSDAIANRLQARGDMVAIQDGYVRKVFAKVHELSCDLGQKQWSGIRSSVIESFNQMPPVEADENGLCCERDLQVYQPLISTEMVALALKNALTAFNDNSKDSFNPETDVEIRDEDKELMYGGVKQ